MKEQIVKAIEEESYWAYQGGFHQVHYSTLHPEHYPPKDLQTAWEDYSKNRIRSFNQAASAISAMVEKEMVSFMHFALSSVERKGLRLYYRGDGKEISDSELLSIYKQTL